VARNNRRAVYVADIPGHKTHGAVTYDGTTVAVYLNGELEASAARALNTVIDADGLEVGRRNSSTRWTGELPAASAIDHFKRDKAKVTSGTPPFPKGMRVSVRDRFTDPGTVLLDLEKPTALCHPVDKHGEGILDDATRLVCYQAKPAGGQPKHVRQTGLHVRDQFGLERLNTLKEAEFCLPSTVPDPFRATWCPGEFGAVLLGTPAGTWAGLRSNGRRAEWRACRSRSAPARSARVPRSHRHAACRTGGEHSTPMRRTTRHGDRVRLPAVQ
jgi:hypothetical protein